MISLTNSGVPFIPIADDTLKSGYKLVLYTPEELTKTFLLCTYTYGFQRAYDCFGISGEDVPCVISKLNALYLQLLSIPLTSDVFTFLLRCYCDKELIEQLTDTFSSMLQKYSDTYNVDNGIFHFTNAELTILLQHNFGIKSVSYAKNSKIIVTDTQILISTFLQNLTGVLDNEVKAEVSKLLQCTCYTYSDAMLTIKTFPAPVDFCIRILQTTLIRFLHASDDYITILSRVQSFYSI